MNDGIAGVDREGVGTDDAQRPEGRRGLRARLGGRGGHALLLVMLLGSALLFSGAVLASRAERGHPAAARR